MPVYMFTFDTVSVIPTNCSVNTKQILTSQISSVCLPPKEDVLNDRNKVRKSNLNGLELSFELISTKWCLQRHWNRGWTGKDGGEISRRLSKRMIQRE